MAEIDPNVQARVLNQFARDQDRAAQIEQNAAAEFTETSKELKVTNNMLMQALRDLQGQSIDSVKIVVDGVTYWLKKEKSSRRACELR